MSEEAPAGPAPEPAGGATAGQLLREAREAAGLHVATLAVALKVPVRKLEALEEDRYDQLPDAVFVRALASSVCRTLKIDPQPVLERLPQTATPRLMQRDDGINAPFRAPGEGPAQNWPEQVSKPAVLVVIALLAGAVVLMLLPARHEENVAAGSNPRKPAASAPAPAAPPAAAPAPEAAPALAAASGSLPAQAASAAAAAASGPALGAASAPVTLAASLPAGAASAPVASGIIVFRTTGESWVKVTDAKGSTVFQKLMKAGEEAGASGSLPLSVTVGSVKTTEVQVRGQPYDLDAVARDNVARFEVK